MTYSTLAAEAVAALNAMTSLQREGIRRSITVPNLALPENAELWAVMAPAMQEEGQTNEAALEDMRAALEDLPLDSWMVINNALFVLHRGNVFDEACKYLEGGGIRFGFDGLQGGRYQTFLGAVEAEASRIGRNISVLDVGCWQGTLMCELLQRGFAVAGTDVCDEVTPIITERVKQLRPEHRLFMGFRAGFAHEALKHYRDGSFDVLTAQETLEHVPAAVLQQTCDQMLRVAKHSVLVEVPFEDGWPLHLRVYTLEDLNKLFHSDRYRIEVIVYPGTGVYTTIKVIKE
ncbi:MAG: class I SAM-dependent methyltransferase [Candidatus Paceibacterota bacterium]|jgi:hypothetical protein